MKKGEKELLKLENFIEEKLTEYGGMSNGYLTIFKGEVDLPSSNLTINKLHLPIFNNGKAIKIGIYIKYFYQGEFERDLTIFIKNNCKTLNKFNNAEIKINSKGKKHGCFKVECSLKIIKPF